MTGRIRVPSRVVTSRRKREKRFAPDVTVRRQSQSGLVALDRRLIACIIHSMNNPRGGTSTVQPDEIDSAAGGMLGLLEVARVLQGRLEKALESVGLSFPKYLALRRLIDAGEPVSLSSLAEDQQCVRSNITQLVDRLETDGLAKRVTDPADRRAVRAAITPLGEERFSAATAAIGVVQAEMASRVAPQDRESFLRVLAAIRTS